LKKMVVVIQRADTRGRKKPDQISQGGWSQDEKGEMRSQGQGVHILANSRRKGSLEAARGKV